MDPHRQLRGNLQVLRIWLVCYGFTSFKDMACVLGIYKF